MATFQKWKAPKRPHLAGGNHREKTSVQNCAGLLLMGHNTPSAGGGISPRSKPQPDVKTSPPDPHAVLTCICHRRLAWVVPGQDREQRSMRYGVLMPVRWSMVNVPVCWRCLGLREASPALPPTRAPNKTWLKTIGCALARGIGYRTVDGEGNVQKWCEMVNRYARQLPGVPGC